MSIVKIFGIVTVGAIAGMIMGGLFGAGAGIIAPGLFRHIVPWSDVEPIGGAVVFGAIVGVLLGGALAVFSIVVNTFHRSFGSKIDG